jgi:hypothetical protein
MKTEGRDGDRKMPSSKISQELKDFTTYIIAMEPRKNVYDLKKWARVFFPIIFGHPGENYLVSSYHVADWLDIWEKNVRSTLRDSYVLGVDYKIVPQARGYLGRGRPEEHYYLSNDCFQKFCMRSNSPNGQRCQDYYIVVSKRYFEYFRRSRDQRLRKETEPQLSKKRKSFNLVFFPEVPGCYIVKITRKGKVFYKVGNTEDINRRFIELQNEFHGDLEIVKWKSFEANVYLEICMQELLHGSEVEHEVFETDLPTVLKAMELCENHLCQMRSEISELLSPEPDRAHPHEKLRKPSRRKTCKSIRGT